MSIDPRHRDAPPVFYLSPQIGGYKYHALLTEPLYIPSNLVMEVYDDERGKREVNGELNVPITRGIYGFNHIEARDKFCRRCNGIADAIEAPVCIPVTVPLLVMEEPMATKIRYQSAT